MGSFLYQKIRPGGRNVLHSLYDTFRRNTTLFACGAHLFYIYRNEVGAPRDELWLKFLIIVLISIM